MAADTTVTWRGLTIGGGGDYHVTSISGWDDLDQVDNSLDQPRVRGNGDHAGDLYSRARIVTVSGSIASPTGRNDLVAALIAATPVSSAVTDLSVTTFGRTLTAGARLLRRSVPTDEDYASGVVQFSLQWRCPDPLRYGPEQSDDTGLPVAGGGLQWPLFSAGHLDWGAAGTSGQITLSNAGSADAALVFEVDGGSTVGLQQGFEISSTDGQRITYPTYVPAGQTLTLDTDSGSVLAEGTADRSGELTRSDWMVVPAADPETGIPGSLTVQFTSLGGAFDAGSQLTARVKETNW